MTVNILNRLNTTWFRMNCHRIDKLVTKKFFSKPCSKFNILFIRKLSRKRKIYSTKCICICSFIIFTTLPEQFRIFRSKVRHIYILAKKKVIILRIFFPRKVIYSKSIFISIHSTSTSIRFNSKIINSHLFTS